jgi:glycosyltransferase involved in cell wall biosynthesis
MTHTSDSAATPNTGSGPAGPPPRFVVVTPCRDEEDHLPATIRTMVEQTVRPTLWVIVDDGSTDRTPQILAEATAAHDFIRVVRRDDRGRRRVGPGVIEAFYAGLDAAGGPDAWDYLCKLDADLELPPRYFETVIAEMRREPRLGNYSGKVYLRLDDGSTVAERMGDENAIGAAKFYRAECFREIGGFVREVCWDGIDGHTCRMLGWIARSEDRPELRIIHRRLMGSSEIGIWAGRRRWGYGKYFMGSAPYFVLVVAIYRMAERPFLIGGLGILWGYLAAMLARKPRYDNPEFRRHLRRYELSSLVRGKGRTAAAYHDRIRAQRGSVREAVAA